MEALGPDDKLATHHRNHGHVIARGSDPKKALAEILGRETGLNRGAGRHPPPERPRPRLHLDLLDRRRQHLASPTAPASRSSRRAATRSRSASSATARSRRESPTSRSTSPRYYDLPVVFVCENNSRGALGSAGGGFPTSVSAVEDLTTIPKTFGIPVETVDGRDLEAVNELAAKAVEHCRARKGPYFIHAVTERWAGSQPLWPELATGELDISMAWDDSAMAGEHEDWYRNHDPVLIYARKLLDSGDLSQDELDRNGRAGKARQIAEAREFALDSPRPTPRVRPRTRLRLRRSTMPQQELRRRDARRTHQVHGGGPELRRHGQRGPRDRPGGHAVRAVPGEVRRPHPLPALLGGRLHGDGGGRGDGRASDVRPPRPRLLHLPGDLVDR